MKAAAAVLCMVLAGCNTAPRLVATRVPVPVVCAEAEPAAPVLPTAALTPASSLDDKVKAALAEIERLRGYAVELLTALRACTASLK